MRRFDVRLLPGKVGLEVLVLERYQDVGGMTPTEELTLPGFRSDGRRHRADP